jgi:hypothetical protein
VITPQDIVDFWQILESRLLNSKSMAAKHAKKRVQAADRQTRRKLGELIMDNAVPKNERACPITSFEEARRITWTTVTQWLGLPMG